jgi:histidinol-phosphatase
MTGFDDDLRFAHVLADAADDVTMRRFRALDLRVDAKPDLTPVTDADLACEEALRNLLRRARPRDAMLGEEFGSSDPAAGGVRGVAPRAGSASQRCWVIDPIDGTKNFVRGVPVWATLIGLMADGEVTVGVVTAPALGRRWWASRGGRAWTGRSLTKASGCKVSQVASLADASVSYSGLSTWQQEGRLEDFLGLVRQTWRSRAYGDFWSHMLVAEGAVDISAETDVKLWDLAALQIIVEEAGGVFTDLTGKPTPSGGSAVCTNGLLHDQVLRLLSPGDGTLDLNITT